MNYEWHVLFVVALFVSSLLTGHIIIILILEQKRKACWRKVNKLSFVYGATKGK